MVAALRLLLGQTRLLSLPRDKRLAALLDDSRRYQDTVSERLAEQVLHALYELLRGFQAPMAVDLAKVSLWLATLARQEPLSWVVSRARAAGPRRRPGQARRTSSGGRGCSGGGCRSTIRGRWRGIGPRCWELWRSG